MENSNTRSGYDTIFTNQLADVLDKVSSLEGVRGNVLNGQVLDVFVCQNALIRLKIVKEIAVLLSDGKIRISADDEEEFSYMIQLLEELSDDE